MRECNGFGKVAADLTRFFKVLQLLMFCCVFAMWNEYNIVYQIVSVHARLTSTITGTSMIRFDSIGLWGVFAWFVFS